MQDRLQECRCRTGAPMPADAELIAADAERRLAVEIGIARQPEFDAGIDPRLGSGVVVAQVRHLELAEAAVILALAALVAFVAPEVRQQFAIAPARRAEPFPVVEILVLAANEDQAVDRRRAAEHAAARPDDRAAARGLARLGLEQARKALVVDRAVVADRQLEPEISIGAAGLQQQHAAGRIGRQPVRDHAAGRSGADDDVVIALSRHASSRRIRPSGIFRSTTRSGSNPEARIVAQRHHAVADIGDGTAEQVAQRIVVGIDLQQAVAADSRQQMRRCQAGRCRRRDNADRTSCRISECRARCRNRHSSPPHFAISG